MGGWDFTPSLAEPSLKLRSFLYLAKLCNTFADFFADRVAMSADFFAEWADMSADWGNASTDFSRIGALSDAWLPGLRTWVGEYPYLLRPAFEELCRLRLSRGGRN